VSRDRLRFTGRRLLIGIPRPDSHRGWLARHGGRSVPGPVPATEPPPAPEFPFALTTDADVPEAVRTRGIAVVTYVARFAPRPILHARMTIRAARDPGVTRPAIATASLDVSGRIVLAHAAAENLPDAIDLLEQRLRRNLDQLGERQRTRRRRPARRP
jgi:ribosome-associated translation inhibitor RaiA